MAKAAKRNGAASKSPKPRSFAGVIKGRTKEVRTIAQALRQLVLEELPSADESYYGGSRPMAMYRTLADVCWIQPLKSRCNLYFTQGAELADPDGLLEGSSDRIRFVRIGDVELLEDYPLREWLRESELLNQQAVSGGLSFDEVLEQLRVICSGLPKTRETLTWGKPHFRVGEKIFCGCGEVKGQPLISLKMEPAQSKQMMLAPGIEKAAYSRPNDGWVSINPKVFDDWSEIETFVIDSFRLIAPKRVAALLVQE